MGPGGHALTGKLEVPGYRFHRRAGGSRPSAVVRDVCAPAVSLTLVHHDESPPVVKLDSARAVEHATKATTAPSHDRRLCATPSMQSGSSVQQITSGSPPGTLL